MATEILELSSSTKFVWKIDYFTNLNAHEGVYSDVFSVGASKWRAQIYPKGYRKVYDHLSLYLCPVDLAKSVHVKFSFAVTSQTNCNNTNPKEGVHNFEIASRGHGWKKFMRLSELHDPDEGYIVNDTCIIEAEVSCRTTEELDNIL
ncbi:hypothetical protein MKX03_023579 [Papaver bracteatum]|nr:hypothetical protein MKX03_023579 [Papaver bracteatum]